MYFWHEILFPISNGQLPKVTGNSWHLSKVTAIHGAFPTETDGNPSKCRQLCWSPHPALVEYIPALASLAPQITYLPAPFDEPCSIPPYYSINPMCRTDGNRRMSHQQSTRDRQARSSQLDLERPPPCIQAIIPFLSVS